MSVQNINRWIFSFALVLSFASGVMASKHPADLSPEDLQPQQKAVYKQEIETLKHLMQQEEKGMPRSRHGLKQLCEAITRHRDKLILECGEDRYNIFAWEYCSYFNIDLIPELKDVQSRLIQGEQIADATPEAEYLYGRMLDTYFMKELLTQGKPMPSEVIAARQRWMDQLHSRAVDLYSRSAARGYAPAMVSTIRSMRDINEDRRFLQQAASSGHAGAQYILGTDSNTPDSQKFEYLMAASNQGHRAASYMLAEEYKKRGQYDEALKYYKNSADKLYVHALAKLGTLHENGELVDQDIAAAVGYFFTSTTQGEYDFTISVAQKSIHRYIKRVTVPVAASPAPDVNEIGNNINFLCEFRNKVPSVVSLKTLGKVYREIAEFALKCRSIVDSVNQNRTTQGFGMFSLRPTALLYEKYQEHSEGAKKRFCMFKLSSGERVYFANDKNPSLGYAIQEVLAQGRIGIPLIFSAIKGGLSVAQEMTTNQDQIKQFAAECKMAEEGEKYLNTVLAGLERLLKVGYEQREEFLYKDDCFIKAENAAPSVSEGSEDDED